MATTPPGWYDDGHGGLRWWDGAQWTEHVATPDAETDESAPTEADIVAASESESTQVPVEVDAATALGFGVPPTAGSPDHPAGATHLDHPQGDYPGGYPGTDAPSGAFTAATEPRKSNLWILWVVLGVVMLGIVIAAAIVIPLIFLSLTSGSSQSSVEPSGADEEAAVAAVELYDDAWQEVDCDAYAASTTEAFREFSQLPDCEAFTSTASEFSASIEDYDVTVTAIEDQDDTILVSTTETYDALFDEEGAPLDSPERQRLQYEYSVVSVEGDWVIDSIDDNTDDNTD